VLQRRTRFGNPTTIEMKADSDQRLALMRFAGSISNG